ncbi:hypothetical protein EJB05_30318 [Eragrostis curvula]|uniref:Uncharacterized protein n=1 Tax=Eragrostis curvula TaxID=38414 RepID=A0A5J9UAR9_9POAL|nr:hypothetical protein EJB05_30318 [Eragrostis curvula]
MLAKLMLLRKPRSRTRASPLLPLCLMCLDRRLRSRTRPQIRVSKPQPRSRSRTRMWAKPLCQVVSHHMTCRNFARLLLT